MAWKERGHKKECKRLLAILRKSKGMMEGAPPRQLVTLPPPPRAPKAAPPIVDGPARGGLDIARAKAAAATATALAATATAPAADEETRCPICLEDFDPNVSKSFQLCCCKYVCIPCNEKLGDVCALCRTPRPETAEASLAMLRRHAANSKGAAVFNLGQCYALGGLGLVPSHKKAARLYERAVELGDVWAMNNLAMSYELGRGVRLDRTKMARYYRMAAERGYPIAQYNLGSCYDAGDGVLKDAETAVRWYALAAGQGHTNAEVNCGVAFANGEGVARDDAEAARWFGRAAAKGDESAARALAALLTRNEGGS